MAKTEFIWDVVTGNVMMEQDGAGNTQAVYTQEPYQYGRLISQRRGNQTSYYHFDGNGNTRALTDAGENVTDTYIDTAFGDEVATTGTTPNRYRYGGQHGYQHNEKTADYYVRERPYEPTRGRWGSKDPLRFVDGMNPYVFAVNEPVVSVDASGQLSQKTAVQNITIFIQGAETIRHTIPIFHVGDCGRFFWKTQWILEPAEKREGVIIQYVKFDFNVAACPSAAATPNKPLVSCKNKRACPTTKNTQGFRSTEYLELWNVNKEGWLAEGNGDIFGNSGTKHICKGEKLAAGTRGTITQFGQGQFLSGDAAAMKKVKTFFRTGPQGVKNACSLPSACATKPQVKTLNALITKNKLRTTKKTTKKIVRSWNCCGCPCPDVGKLKCSIDGKQACNRRPSSD
ncbi:MAG: RHS repeat domain-containing protein [Planctomycetaceae bacterium]